MISVGYELMILTLTLVEPVTGAARATKARLPPFSCLSSPPANLEAVAVGPAPGSRVSSSPNCNDKRIFKTRKRQYAQSSFLRTRSIFRTEWAGIHLVIQINIPSVTV